MILESLAVAVVVAYFAAHAVLTRKVYQLSGKIEDGFTDDLRVIATDVKTLMKDQGQAREEQARQGARIDSLYNRWVD